MSQQTRKSCLSPDKCPYYSRSITRCLAGYVDPKRIGEGTKAARTGFLAPCPYTERGQKVLQRLEREETGPKPVSNKSWNP